MKHATFPTALLTIILVAGINPAKANHAQSPDAIVTNAVESALEYIRNNSHKAPDHIAQGITRILRPIFHFPSIVSQVIGHRWRNLNTSKKDCVTRILKKDMLSVFFSQAGSDLSSGTLRYSKVLRKNSTRATVKVVVDTGSMAKSAGNRTFLFSMKATHNGWRVSGVTVDQFNLVATYKNARGKYVTQALTQASNGECKPR